MDKVLSGSGVTKVSTNGIEPFGHVSSTVDLMDWSKLLMCLRKFLCSDCCTMKVSPICLLHNPEGVSIVLMAHSSKCSMYMLAIMELTGDPMATSSTCS